MAEVLASLKKIGGNGEQYTETSLWTNPSPTAQFAGQTVTLSDSIANYKYLKVKACYNGGYTDVAVSPLILVSEFMTIVPSTRRCTFNIGNSSAGNSYYSRAVQYVSPTSISFTDDWALKSNNTANTDVIPLEILGINELAHGTIYEHYAMGYFTNTVRSVDLGFVPKYVFCANGGSTSGSNNSNIIIYDANVSTTQFKFIANGTEEMRNIGTIGSTVQFSMEGTVIGMNPNTTITNFVNSHRQYVAIGYDNQ